MNQKNKNSRSQTLITILLLFFLFYMVYSVFYSSGNYGEKIEQSEIISKIEAGEVVEWYAYNGICRVKIKDSEITNFPKSADFYCEYTASSLILIMDATVEFNSLPQNTDKKITWDNPPVRQSILETIFPYLFLVFSVIFGFMIFRTLSKGNSGALSFGKSKARSGENIKVRFHDVAGADEEKTELEEIVQFLKSPKQFTDLGARIPKGVLLVGQPGTGKTLLAKAVAGESNVPFLSISGSDFVEMFVGVGASRVRDLFEQAKRNKPCIIFIDEIDAVGRQRGTGLGGGNDEREQTLNQLLVEMDGFEANEGIIVLAATNRSDVLDPALMRPGRFDRQIYVHVPDIKGRESIIKIHAKNKPLDKDIDYNTLARITSGFTGADLENMLNEAAILAARSNRPKIIMEDLTEGINKVIMGPQKKSRITTDRDKKITAYHESGHAILGRLLKHCDEVQEVSIIPRGMAAGYTMSRPSEDDNHMTFNKLNDHICMIMGGRIAEELIFKDISTGAQNDIQKATEISRRMITEWGMSRKLGFMCFDTGNEPFLGRDYQSKNTKHSEKIAGEIDDEMMNILNTNYSRSKKLLHDNIDLLHKMSELLLKKETIYKEEVDMLIEGKSVQEVIEHIEQKIAERVKRQSIDRKEIEITNKIKEYETKIKTAEVLVKTGVVSPQEFQKLNDACNILKAELEKFYDEKLTDEVSLDKEETQTEANKKVNDQILTKVSAKKGTVSETNKKETKTSATKKTINKSDAEKKVLEIKNKEKSKSDKSKSEKIKTEKSKSGKTSESKLQNNKLSKSLEKTEKENNVNKKEDQND